MRSFRGINPGIGRDRIGDCSQPVLPMVAHLITCWYRWGPIRQRGKALRRVEEVVIGCMQLEAQRSADTDAAQAG